MMDGGFAVLYVPDFGGARLIVGLDDLKEIFSNCNDYVILFCDPPELRECQEGDGDTHTRRLTMGTAARSALRTML